VIVLIRTEHMEIHLMGILMEIHLMVIEAMETAIVTLMGTNNE
jgi:hypothetical protein